MLGNIALYMANRAASGAVVPLARWAAWGAVAGVFFITAIVAGLMGLYTWLEPQFGAVSSLLIISAAALVAALVAIAIPVSVDAMDRAARQRELEQKGAIASTTEAVEGEAAAAVDYFGPLQVVSSAFLVGLSTGRRFKRR